MKRMRLLTGFGLSCLVCLATLVGVAAPRAAEQGAQPATPTAVPPAQTSPAAAPGRPIDFNWDVRPILSDNCFRCHGPDEKNRQAGLRLDTAEGAYAALRRPGTFAVVPGKPAESQMIFRITHANAAVRMPPQVTNKVLTPQQVEILRAWIAQGAQYKPHWAFMPPQRAAAPAVPAGPSILNDVDRFVQARLDREGLKLSSPADKETLINRVTLTLTGLPPTLAEVDAFLADTSPQAYEKLVDRLLASTAYGEHVGGQWLDIARYAESDGFLDDTHDRLLWPYRDWVIAAIEQEHAVRPVCDVAAGGRSAAEPHEGAAAGDGVHARRQAINRERRDRRGVPRRICGGSGHDGRHGVSRDDGRLCAVPRPQVRPDSHERLLLADRVLQQHGRARILCAGAFGHHARPDDALGRRGDREGDRRPACSHREGRGRLRRPLARLRRTRQGHAPTPFFRTPRN